MYEEKLAACFCSNHYNCGAEYGYESDKQYNHYYFQKGSGGTFENSDRWLESHMKTRIFAFGHHLPFSIFLRIAGGLSELLSQMWIPF
jgi:hypothetical protein